ncbi:signal peptidase I [Dermatobacter hominis]|uniref:signal peptidase I n=1 Tax=Dermatobacter hominis TaxID=2884263 RepID=UPI001D11B01F|nr:signal peptidase I [Dermatobacter hominis]UDY34685.1 signal peptidase I [Dermatobacter hominis]
MTEHRDGAGGAGGDASTGAGRSARAAELASVLGTGALLFWLAFLTRDGRWPVSVLVALALLVGSAGVLADLVASRAGRRAEAGGAPTDGAEGTVTTIVVLGDEPVELQRHSVVLAQGAGPCVVVGTAEHADALADLGVTVVSEASQGEAIARAVAGIDTDAVLLVSGRATPVAASCRRAAARLDDDHPWAIGRTRPFNPDGFAPDSRGRVDAELRRRASACGLALWEPNATLVRTADLRRDPLPSDRPRGAWLRARQGEGGQGLVLDDDLALVAAPAGARTFWPESLAQQRGASADAAHAVRTSRGVPRLLALLLTARDSFAWSLIAWLAVLFTGTISGELPFRTVRGTVIALLAAVAVLRWAGLYRSVGQALRPARDLRSTVDRMPGSLAALPSVLAGRVLRGPRKVSVRPLLWAGLLSAAVLATALVDHPPDRQMTAPAVGAALLTLVLLWVVCIQVLVQRGWERTSFRLPLALPVTVAGRTGTTLDASPEGLAIELPPTHEPAIALPAHGDRVAVDVDLPSGGPTPIEGVVAWARRTPRRDLVGLSLELDATTRAIWAQQVLRAATDPATPTATPIGPVHAPGARRPAGSRALDVAGLAMTVVLSLVLLAVLGGAMLGLQAAVVRSGSMTPTIGQGSIVISESERVSDLRPGDVVTRPAEGRSEPVTHRLVSATRQGGDYLMQTQGDANASGETWTIPADTTLQRVRWVIPSLGDAVALLRSNLVVVLGAVLVLGLVVIAVRLPRRGGHGAASGRQPTPA